MPETPPLIETPPNLETTAKVEQPVTLVRGKRTRIRTPAVEEKISLEERLKWEISDSTEIALPPPKVTAHTLSIAELVELLDAGGVFKVESRSNLAKVLAPFGLHVPGPPHPKTGQHLQELRLTRDMPDQVEAVLEGIHLLSPAMKQHQGGIEFVFKPLGAQTREKNWLRVTRDGAAQVLSSTRPAAHFADLRSALNFISKERPTAENSPKIFRINL